MITLNIKIKRKRTSGEGGFISESIKLYIKASTPKELRFDWIGPLILSVLVFSLMAIFTDSNIAILKVMEKINNAAINVVAILAGFNTASLAVITSSNRDLLNSLNMSIPSSEKVEFKKLPLFKRIKNSIFNNTKSNTLRITINFFCYAVIIQLITLIFGLLTGALYDFLPNITKFHFFAVGNWIEKSLLLTYGTLWLTLILHSIFISLRNVEMVFHFIIYKDQH